MIVSHITGKPINKFGRNSGRTYRMLEEAIAKLARWDDPQARVIVVMPNAYMLEQALQLLRFIALKQHTTFAVRRIFELSVQRCGALHGHPLPGVIELATEDHNHKVSLLEARDVLFDHAVREAAIERNWTAPSISEERQKLKEELQELEGRLAALQAQLDKLGEST